MFFFIFFFINGCTFKKPIGNVKVLIPALAEVEGKKMLMADDLDVDWERGLIYLSDVSTKYGFHRWAWSIVDNDASGR